MSSNVAEGEFLSFDAFRRVWDLERKDIESEPSADPKSRMNRLEDLSHTLKRNHGVDVKRLTIVAFRC